MLKKKLFLFSLLAVGNLMHGAQNYPEYIDSIEKSIQDGKNLVFMVRCLEDFRFLMEPNKRIEFDICKTKIEKLKDDLPRFKASLEEYKKTGNEQKLSEAMRALSIDGKKLCGEILSFFPFTDRLDTQSRLR